MNLIPPGGKTDDGMCEANDAVLADVAFMHGQKHDSRLKICSCSYFIASLDSVECQRGQK